MRDLTEIKWPRLPSKITLPNDTVIQYDAVFQPSSPVTAEMLLVVCSIGHGWDHVSVSLGHRCPTWAEMEWVKRTLFKSDEVVMQLHVPPKDHINIHPNVLHLWRPQNCEIPLPPKELV